MTDPMLPLPGLSPVCGKAVVAKFDGGLLSSDVGVLVLREVEQRLRVADRLAACMVDPRAPDLITHTLADIIRFRLLMIGAGLAVKLLPVSDPPRDLPEGLTIKFDHGAAHAQQAASVGQVLQSAETGGEIEHSGVVVEVPDRNTSLFGVPKVVSKWAY